MKTYKKLFIVVLAVVLALSFTACGKGVPLLRFETDCGSEISADGAKKGETFPRPAQDPVKPGCVFDNWYKDAEKTVLFDFENTVIESKGTVIYARWIGNHYTVHYDANGGEGEMEDSEHVFDAPVALRANQFVKIGQDFAGWNTAADGSGSFYANEEPASIATEPDGEVTLYAQWLEGNVFGAYTVEKTVAASVENADKLIVPQEPWTQNDNPVYWNGEVFEGLFAAKVKILLQNSMISFYINGKGGSNREGGGWWQVGPNSGTISYTISGNIINIQLKNTKSGDTDGGNFTIESKDKLSGKMSGTSATAYRYSNVTGLTLNSNGTGLLRRDSSSVTAISGEREITWEINSEGHFIIKENDIAVGIFDFSKSEYTYKCAETNGSRFLNAELTVKLSHN